jgi:hypothetical protein
VTTCCFRSSPNIRCGQREPTGRRCLSTTPDAIDLLRRIDRATLAGSEIE